MIQKTTHFATGLFIVLSMMAGFSNSASAQDNIDPGAPQSFLPKMSALDQMEIQAGTFGNTKACDVDVKAYGQQLVTEHTAHLSQVQTMAGTANVDLAQVTFTEAESKRFQELQAEMTRIQQIPDCSFDAEFLEAMAEAHAFAIEVVDKAHDDVAEDEGNDEMEGFLESTQAALETHHERAEELMAELDEDGNDNGNGNGDGQTPQPSPNPGQDQSQDDGI